MPDVSRTRRFEAVIMPHLDAAYSLARWLVRDPADSEDVVQEAMMRAYRFFDGCRADSARAWVLRIVRNACYDWLRAKADAGIVGFCDLDPLDPEGAAFTADVFTAPTADPEQLLADKDCHALVNQALAALPAPLREVVVLREFEDLSYQQIADVLGVPIGTVMSRLSRARASLLKEWNSRHGRSGM